jgi:hypothetical protein
MIDGIVLTKFDTIDDKVRPGGFQAALCCAVLRRRLWKISPYTLHVRTPAPTQP